MVLHIYIYMMSVMCFIDTSYLQDASSYPPPPYPVSTAEQSQTYSKQTVASSATVRDVCVHWMY